MVNIDNKNTYFRVVFEFDIKNSHVDVETERIKLKEEIDIFLTKISASHGVYMLSIIYGQSAWAYVGTMLPVVRPDTVEI